MKRLFKLELLLLFLPFYGFSQDQSINGNLALGPDGISETGIGNVLTFQGVRSNTDVLSMFRFNRAYNSSDLRISIGDDVGSPGDRFVVGATNWADAQYNPFFIVHADGRVTIGTEEIRDERLAVNGKIRAHEIKVETGNWPDYVFDDGYKKTSLEELEKYISLNKHLPEMPSALEVKINGIELGYMNKKLLKQQEEFVLHLIEKDREIKALKEENKAIRSKLDEIITLLNNRTDEPQKENLKYLKTQRK